MVCIWEDVMEGFGYIPLVGKEHLFLCFHCQLDHYARCYHLERLVRPSIVLYMQLLSVSFVQPGNHVQPPSPNAMF